MKINWKVRFKNKLFLSAFFGLIVSFVYSMLALFDVFPTVTQSSLMQVINNVLTFLGLVGVLADPTTEGLYDSDRAMTYQEPWKDGETNVCTEGNDNG